MAIDCRVHQALSIRAYTDERSIRTFLTSDLWPEGPLERRCQAGIRCRYPFEQAIRGSFHILDSLIIPRLPPAKFSTSQYKRLSAGRRHPVYTGFELIHLFSSSLKQLWHKSLAFWKKDRKSYSFKNVFSVTTTCQLIRHNPLDDPSTLFLCYILKLNLIKTTREKIPNALKSCMVKWCNAWKVCKVCLQHCSFHVGVKKQLVYTQQVIKA